MAQLFLCIENVPIFQVDKIFYSNPVHAGQQRSTRFQDFKDPKYIKLPSSVEKPTRESYENVMQYWMKCYCDALEPTQTALSSYFKPESENKQHQGALQARTFDMARSFLPIGLQSSVALVMSARSWSELVGYLKGSNQIADLELGNLLHTLLTGHKELEKLGYSPEADNLIRHSEANFTRDNSSEKILNLLKENVNKRKNIVPKEDFNIDLSHDSIRSVIEHYMLLINPLLDSKKITVNRKVLEKIGDILSKSHNHHNQIGPVSQTGGILIEGFGDYGGILKDINRHRSLERFYPLFSNQLNIQAELDREEKDCFVTYEYLKIPQFRALRKDYEDKLVEGYKLINNWMGLAKKSMDQDMLREYTRYLLPHCHLSRYRLYGSVDDWQYVGNLRSRNGGHIQYRKASYLWIKELAKKSPLLKGFYEILPEVDAKSRAQFFDRS